MCENSASESLLLNDSLEADEHMGLTDVPVLPETNFEWISIFVDVVVTIIMSFSVLYLILEVNEVANFPDLKENKKINNIVETVYLSVALLAMISHIYTYGTGTNRFHHVDFDNYPMLGFMIICALFDVAYYVMEWIIVANSPDPALVIAILSETFFAALILPFVIICVCTNVRPNEEYYLEKYTKMSILLAMGGCLVIYMRRVTIKIENDFFNITRPYNSNFAISKAHSAESVLELLHIAYIVICFIFLIDPLRISSKKKEGDEDKDSKDDEDKSEPKMEFLKQAGFIKWRIPTLCLSIASCLALIIEYYFVLEVDFRIQNNTYLKKQFETCNITVYIIGILLGTFYYFADIRFWIKKEKVKIKNDENFNDISATIQILYGAGMIIFFIFLSQGKVFYFDLFNFILMDLQILIQSGCIKSAIRKKPALHQSCSFNSIIFPSLGLAAINFGFMVISILYSQRDIFIADVKKIQVFLFYAIKDVALPVTIVNRLHGTAFFLNLSMEQWYNRPTDRNHPSTLEALLRKLCPKCTEDTQRHADVGPRL